MLSENTGDVMRKTTTGNVLSVFIAFCMIFAMVPFIQNASVNGNGSGIVAAASTSYSVSYNTNGGTGSYPAEHIYFNDSFIVNTQKPVNPGYTFKGWGLNRLSDNKWYAAGGVGWKTSSEIAQNNYVLRIYDPGTELRLGDSWIQGETTSKGFSFVAQWTPKSYNIAYDLNGGSGTFSTIRTAMRETFTISASVPARGGYAFKGWNLLRNSDGKYYVAGVGWLSSGEISSGNYTARLYDPGTSLTFGGSMVVDGIDDSDFTFKALWESTAHVHSWGDWETTKAATCAAEGVRSSTCSGCGEVRTESIARTEHDWDAGIIVKPAKYYSSGVRTYTCKICGLTKSSPIPALNVALVTPAKVRVTSAKTSGKKLIVKWKRIVKNTKGYQLAVKDKKTGKQKYINVAQGRKTTLSKTVKKLKKKKTYSVRVRAYNVIGDETIYGPWSNVKTGKIR